MKNRAERRKKEEKRRQLQTKIDYLKAKAEYNKQKAAILVSKPGKYARIAKDLQDMEDLKDEVGSNDVNKYLKLLENPVVQAFLLRILASKGVDIDKPMSTRTLITELGRKVHQR